MLTTFPTLPPRAVSLLCYCHPTYRLPSKTKNNRKNPNVTREPWSQRHVTAEWTIWSNEWVRRSCYLLLERLKRLSQENTYQQGNRLWHNTGANARLLSRVLPRFLSLSFFALLASSIKEVLLFAVLSFHSYSSYWAGTLLMGKPIRMHE